MTKFALCFMVVGTRVGGVYSQNVGSDEALGCFDENLHQDCVYKCQ